jgi:hypothetical protein
LDGLIDLSHNGRPQLQNLATALGQSADQRPQLVVRQVAHDSERFAMEMSLAAENVNGELMQLQALLHRTRGRRVEDERVRDLKGSAAIVGLTTCGSTCHCEEPPCDESQWPLLFPSSMRNGERNHATICLVFFRLALGVVTLRCQQMEEAGAHAGLL